VTLAEAVDMSRHPPGMPRAGSLELKIAVGFDVSPKMALPQ
jgi:hypothetical protein